MAKGEFRRKAEVPGTEQIWRMAESGERLSRAAAVALIASRITRKAGQDDGVLRNNVQSAMAYDISKGTLAAPGASGFVVCELIEWARERFREDRAAFEGLPRAIRFPVKVGLYETLGINASLIRGVVLPATVEECHERIRERDSEIVRLTESVRELKRFWRPEF